MTLTLAQLQALKAFIAADPTLDAFPHNADGAIDILPLLNVNAAPDYWVWRTSVTKNEYTNTVSPDGTTFNWTGAGFITRSVGERDAWRELFNGAGVGNNAVNPSLANVRQAMQDIFSGATAPAPANRTHLLAMSRRKARVGEKLFAIATVGGSGTRGSTANPDTMSPEGTITAANVLDAWLS